MTSSTVKLFRKFSSVFTLFFILIIIISEAASTDDIIPVTSITAEQSDIILAVGKSIELSPEIMPEDATDKTIIFTSEDSNIVTVENNIITAQTAGSTIITASWTNDNTISVTYSVTSVDISINIEQPDITLAVGKSIELSPTVLPEDAPLVFTSADNNIISVENNVITAQSAGSTTITASWAHDNTISATYYVTSVDISIGIEQPDITLAVGKSIELSPTVLPEDAPLVFTSADNNIISVENNIITAQSAGSTSITASWAYDSTIKATYNVTSVEGSIDIEQSRIYTNVGENVTLNINITPDNLITKDEIEYTTSNPNIATVANGTVIPVARGIATITASTPDGNYYDTIEIVVSGIAITTNVDALELKAGDTHTLNTEILADPNVINSLTFTWNSSDSAIAQVADNGTITCNATGEATITVTCNEIPTITTSVNIKVCGIKLNTYILNIYMGNEFDLVSSIISNKTIVNQDIIWSSSDLSVATVSNGMVTPISSGSCMITISNSETGYTTSCSINVSTYSLASTIYNVDRSLKSIVDVGANTNIAQFKANLSNFSSDIVITNSDGSSPSGDLILSGMIANLVVDNTIKDSMTIIVKGDINGDGVISISDYTLLRLHILNLKKIDPQYNLVSSDTNYDNAISISDYTLIRLDILGIRKLNDDLNALPEISNANIKQMVETALSQYGKPYSWGDEGPDKFDCSGLVYYCIKSTGYSLIRSTAHNYAYNNDWANVSKENLQPGDLMFFQSDSNPNKIGHTAIYLNDGYFIHASGSYSNVVISKLEGYYATMFTHGKRVYY